jgi:homoserine O-acetyltransferase
MLRKLAMALCALMAMAGTAAAAPEPAVHDLVLKDFRFRSGQTLPELRIHYYTLGQPRRDASGAITNAVLILHGTGGTGRQFLSPQFADVLFAPGGLLDPASHYIILPDGIGHGGSSKPSDGLRMAFPNYDYADMVEAEHALVAQGLGVKRLRLIMGRRWAACTPSCGARPGPTRPRALMPLACLPAEIAGRNRMWRRMAIEAITADPAFTGRELHGPARAGSAHRHGPVDPGRPDATAAAARRCRPARPPTPVRRRAAAPHGRQRRQRLHLRARRLAHLRSLPRPGEDHRADHLGELRR